MANKTLFSSIRGRFTPTADAKNEAGGLAYKRSAQENLAQLATTGCLGSTFYASAQDQLDNVLKCCEKLDAEYIARTALYAREVGYMKDMPALLCAVLSVKSPGLMVEVFSRVINSPRMLRNFVQIMRSGVVGRKSLGSLPKRMVLQWLESRTDDQLFIGSVGNDPSLADILRMVHPTPATPSREALFGYLIGRKHNAQALPELVKQFENFKRTNRGGNNSVPNVPFQMLTSLPLTPDAWNQIARNAPWQMTRMNLNTFLRHDVFKSRELTTMIANRLRNPRLIEKARVFPYQLMVAHANASPRVPHEVREALQDAMEIAIKNVPRVVGQVYVCPDVSGSMHSPVSGHRKGATSSVRCIDIAALVAAAMLRMNPKAEVLPFESKTVNVRLNPRDSVMTNAQRLASLPCGGTNCSAPLRTLNKRKAKGDLIIYISDNESWIDSPNYGRCGGGRTQTMNEWSQFKTRNPNARMVCIDIQPNGTTQAVSSKDILNVGGFSDYVFKLLADVAADRHSPNHWVREIEQVRL